MQIAGRFGFQHEIIRTSELQRAGVPRQSRQPLLLLQARALHAPVALAADRRAIVVDGNNADDRGDYRPGRQAAREFGVRSPLDEANLEKQEIRELSRRLGLPSWDEPASACLSSRIPYHSEVTDEKLRTIERAEQALRGLGFRVCRVRHHDELARIEFGRDEIARALEPETVGGDRPRGESRRLPLRHDRSARLSIGQSERRASARSPRDAVPPG